ncbi:hypothetical protein [Streptomyces chilikensis]|uniref:Uncharacterized protein n=1 Tax=Streptomyces chilikensis TaxID=1194079 RepID=A0ABV3EWA8_9ACTN
MEDDVDHLTGRRTRTALAALCGASAVVAAVPAWWRPWLPQEEAEAKLDRAGIVACSGLIVKGTVDAVGPAGAGMVRVRLEGARRLEPGGGSGEGSGGTASFLVPEGDAGAYAPGGRVLVAALRSGEGAPLLFTGAEIEPAWDWMEAEARDPAAPSCPTA